MLAAISFERRFVVFPVTALVLLVIGVMAMRASPVMFWSPGTKGWDLRPESPVFACAGLCCFYAAVYGLRVLPLSDRVSNWHPVLSVVGLALFGIGVGLVYHRMAADRGSTGLGALGMAGIWLLLAGGLGLFLRRSGLRLRSAGLSSKCWGGLVLVGDELKF